MIRALNRREYWNNFQTPKSCIADEIFHALKEETEEGETSILHANKYTDKNKLDKETRIPIVKSDLKYVLHTERERDRERERVVTDYFYLQ